MYWLYRAREEFWWFWEQRINRDAPAAFVMRRRYRAQNDRTRRYGYGQGR